MSGQLISTLPLKLNLSIWHASCADEDEASGASKGSATNVREIVTTRSHCDRPRPSSSDAIHLLIATDVVPKRNRMTV